MPAQLPEQNNEGLIRQHLAHQQTMPHSTVIPPSGPFVMSAPDGIPDTYPFQVTPQISEPMQPSVKSTKKWLRISALVLVGILALSTYLIWHSSTAPAVATVSTTQQHFSVASTSAALKTAPGVSPVAANGKIQIYIVGAVKKPGVYTLEGNARVYQLLQAAGGPLPQANLVALNLAARLSDGQEIYVTQIGETPPPSMSSTPSTNTTGTSGGTSSQQININTASADELRKGLHISSTNAQAIINYRIQHSHFTSVEELLQVVSQATYKKIKNEVTLA